MFGVFKSHTVEKEESVCVCNNSPSACKERETFCRLSYAKAGLRMGLGVWLKKCVTRDNACNWERIQSFFKIKLSNEK